MSSSGGVQSTVPSASSSYQSTSTAFTLSKFSGNAGSNANLNLDLSHASDNGNPVVKSFVQNTFEASGYSLYDSDDIKYWKYIGWDSNGQRNVTRHQMNQTVTTSNPIFDNINLMLKQFNGVLRYSNGEYQLVVKGQTPSVFVNGEVLYESDIIGDISLKDAGVKKSYNSVSSSIKDPQAKFESRSVNFFNSDYLKQDKFIPKKGNYGMPGVTNYFNARFNVNQYLDESRYGLTVSFKMMPKGILLQPGSIIKLNYPRFGWENKEFRINSLTMNSDCLVQVTADEHNNSAFLIKKVSKPSVGTEVATATPVNINTPAAPTNLAGAGKVPGTFVLTWDNATDFDLDTHTTEVYANTTHNDKDHANTKLIAKGLQVERYDHTVEADTANTTQYFWVKHVVVRTNKLGSRDIRSLFAPNTTAGVSTVAPIRHKGKWNIAVSSLPTSAALSNTRWGDGTGERPDTLVAGDEAWFFTGNQNAPSGQKIWQYTGSTWTEITQAIRGDVVVDGSVTTTEIADGTILADNIDQTASAGKFGEVVAALGTFTQVDTDVLNANSVIAREVQVFPSGGTPPTISGTTLAGAGIDLKQDGDMYVGNAAANKYMFWDQSAGTMTFRGTLNVDDITGSSAKFSTLMAEVATIGTLNTEMLDSDAIVTRDIRVGPSVETNAGSFATGTEYYITVLGNTTQAQWNSVAGTSGVVYNLGSIFTAANAGTGTGKARNRTTVAKIAGATLTGTGAHLNSDGDFYVGNASTNKYMFWDQSAGTMQIRGALNADDITAGNITASNINVTNLAALSANLGNVTAGTLKGGTIPEASSAPTTTESGTFFDLTGGRMVLGNASKYIWWNGTNLEINGVTISDATLSGSTGFATETFVNTAINNLVANAPAALDTLNEIAAALDDDASFHSSVTTSLSNKVGTTSAQALTSAANAMTISGSTISLARANGDTDTVAVPNDNTEYTAGSGLALSGTIFSNSAPDQTVALTGSGATSISGTYPNFTISSSNTNTQRSDEEIRDVAASIITAGTNVSVVKNDAANTVTISSNFTNTQRTDEEIRDLAAGILTAGTNVSISVNDAANTATISSTNTQYTAGSGLSLSGTQFSNSAPDQTVSLTGAGGATISGTYPNFTISSANSVYTHPAYTPRSINTSGATVLDTFTSDAIGSVTSIGTRTLTLANLGYTGATNANFYVLPGSVVHSTESQALNSDPLRISGSTLSLYKGDGTFDSVTLPSVSPANNTITLTAGVGLSGGGAFTLNQGSNETITLTADLSELPDMTETFTSTDELVVLDSGVSKRKQTSEIALSTFNNDLTFSAATTLGGQSASHYLNVNTTFGGDVSGKYNAIVIADDSHNHTIANVAGLQTALNGKVDDGQVLTNVPTGALFTDTNTNTITQVREDSGSYRTGNITLQSGTNVSITEPTTGVFRFTSTDTNTVYSHPNHTGDVTSSGDGAQTIANNVVTFAKMQDIATDTFMGRTASGSGDAKALSVSEARTMLNVENGATADQSASEILTLLKTVDSNTSGLNADTLDGQQGTYYYAASNPNSYTSNVGDITAVTVSAPITGGGASGSVGIGITQASGSANGYLSSTDWTTFNNKSTFNGAYSSLSGRPTLFDGAYGSLSGRPTLFDGAYSSLSGKPTLLTLGTSSSTALAGNTAIPVDLTTSGAGTVHANNYVNTQYVAATSSVFGLVKIGFTENNTARNYPVVLSSGQMYVNVPWTDANDNTITRVGIATSLVSGDITISASGAATATQSGNTVNIHSVNENTEYTANNGVQLTGTVFSHVDTSSQASVDNSGRNYIQDITLDTFGHITGITSTSVPSELSTSGNTNIELDPGGSGVVIFKGNSTKGAGQFKLNCENNSHGITIKGPPHSAAASYTLTLPNNDGNANQVLKTDGSGVTSWVAQSSSGVESLSAVGSSGISVVDGSTGTPEIGTTGNLAAIMSGDAISGTLRTDILEANTVLATYITADSINANHLAVSNNVADATSQGIYFDANGVITIRDSSGNIRVKIGDLS